MILGTTGPICAGNNAVGDIIRQAGFIRLSLSDELRRYMRERGIEINRENMRDTADSLRKKYGHGYMATFVTRKILTLPNQDYVVEAIMNPAEITELKKLKDFYLIKVDAPVETRFERLVKRNRDSDEPRTLEKFIEWEKRDLGIGQPAHGLHRAACFEMADYTIVNDGTVEQLNASVLELLKKLKPV